MEFNFFLLVIAALVGLVVNAIWGFNPWAIIGALSLLILFFPVLGLAFQPDPQAAQAIADNMVERVVNALPSLIIGGLAGELAATIFKAVKGGRG
jgi:hypothetical protein